MILARFIAFFAATLCGIAAPAAEAGQADDQAKVKALEERLGEMFGRMNASEPQSRAAAHKAFRSYRLTDDEHALLFARYRYSGLVLNPGEGGTRERTIDVVGVTLLYKYHNVPAHGRLDSAWREYFRYLDDPSPTVRAIAFRRAANAQIASIELLPTAFGGCADPATVVRSGAFYLLGSILSEVPRDDPRFAEARELVLRAFQDDREVERGGLFLCAPHFGATMEPHADQLYAGMFGEFRINAARALAAADTSPDRIDRVVATLSSGDQSLEGAAITYLNYLSPKSCAKSKALVVHLTKWLADPAAERRLSATRLALLKELPTLRRAALAEAERLMTQAPENDCNWRQSLAEAVFFCGSQHLAGRSTMRNFLRHPSNEIRCVAHNVLLGQFPSAEAYRAEIEFAVSYDPDPECRRIAGLALAGMDQAAELGV